MGWVVKILFLEFPSYVKQLGVDFAPVFEQKKQLLQFERLMSTFPVAEKHSIAHMNGMFTHHTNQSNLNRFGMQSGWDTGELQRITIDIVNAVEKDGLLAIDDTIVEKMGREMYGVEWHLDHSKGKSVWGMSIADCVFTGNEIYPVASKIYVRREGVVLHPTRSVHIRCVDSGWRSRGRVKASERSERAFDPDVL